MQLLEQSPFHHHSPAPPAHPHPVLYFKQRPLPGIWHLKVKVSESHSVLSDSAIRWTIYSPRNSPGQNTGVGNLSLLQEIFPTQGLNPSLPHCRQILSHRGSPIILEWVVYPFSSGSSWPRNPTGVSWIVGRFFTNWAIREATFFSESEILCNCFPDIKKSSKASDIFFPPNISISSNIYPFVKPKLCNYLINLSWCEQPNKVIFFITLNYLFGS